MKISVVGTGYVGSVTAACFAELGHEVICIDIDEEKVQKINDGIAPIHENGLEELLRKHTGRSLHATTDYQHAIMNSDISFICVGTPCDEDGMIDLTVLKKACESLGSGIGQKGGYHVAVVKSTVVPMTTENVVIPLLEKCSGKRAGKDFGVAMNPEFLREGMAVYDFMHPDKIVVGAYDQKSGSIVSDLYEGIECEVTRTNLRTAEMIKYANNSFLATKISFSNEIGNICKKMGIDCYDVMKEVGKDFRISPHFLNSGAGFGGSCFPKDVQALVNRSMEIGYEPSLLKSVIELNDRQPLKMIELLEKKIEDFTNKRIAVLGLAFKNGTDDIRESRSIPVIDYLIRKGAHVIAYDPMASDNMKRLFDNIEYATSAASALENAHACLLMTEWDEFRNLDSELAGMHRRLVIDGRHLIDPNSIENDIEYEGICW